jgi:hypothetical protein
LVKSGAARKGQSVDATRAQRIVAEFEPRLDLFPHGSAPDKRLDLGFERAGLVPQRGDLGLGTDNPGRIFGQV